MKMCFILTCKSNGEDGHCSDTQVGLLRGEFPALLCSEHVFLCCYNDGKVVGISGVTHFICFLLMPANCKKTTLPSLPVTTTTVIRPRTSPSKKPS